ncbi:MAG TPA: mersacidin/lichenicidin family type 2 lantibiotic [Kofleriaceae bacterium]|nr:mersacidin/lichenicidin family type 2 lantibiotic [Kofleriaceae bacterium]
MTKEAIIRAWRDQDYFLSLSDDERALLPPNPAGMVELSEDALTNVLGASHSTCFQSCHPQDPSCNCDSCWSGGTLCCC